RIERKMLWRERIKAAARGRAEIAVRVQGFRPRRVRGVARLLQQKEAPFAPFKGCLHGIAEANADFIVDDEAVHHSFYGVALLWLKLDSDIAAQLDDLPIDPRAHETFPSQALDYVAEFSLLPRDDRRQKHDASFDRQCENFVNDITGGLARDRLAAVGAMRLAHIGEKQAQVIVNLGCRGNDRARVARSQWQVKAPR